MKIKKLGKESVYTKELPTGCKYCRKGAKMVLLVTGVCHGNCWYCPLSSEKRGKDVIYADEKKINSEEDILNEARSIDALGTGITGGDPFENEWTIDLIRLLKAEFGEGHHIHLYTRSTEIDKIRAFNQAGLDEIRFHPPADIWGDIEDSEYLLTIKDIGELDLDVGIEIPSIPKSFEATVHFLRQVEDLVDFVNINELEFSDTNWEQLVARGYKKKSDISNAVKGSQEAALELFNYGFNLSLHYCSASFKDCVQLKNRLKRRANNVARKGDIITEEGTLIRGVIESKFGEKLVKDIQKRYSVPPEFVWYDEKKDRVEISLEILEEIHPLLKDKCYGIEEYPTADRLEVERWPLE